MLLLGAALACSAVILPPAASAQQPERSAPPAIAVSIPAQPLPAALEAFIRITGWQVGYSSRIADGITAPSVSGTMPPEQALRALLAGSGIGLRLTGPSTVTLVSPETTSAIAETAPGEVVLDTLDVQWNGKGAPVGYVPRTTRTGSKTDTPILEVPQSISVITPRQIKDQAPRSVNEAVRYTAGVRTGSYGFDPRFDWISIRGFPGTGEYRDGLIQPIGYFSRFRTEIYGLERLDIVKGPVSVLYGQSDPAGLVDRISKRPTATILHELELQPGNYDRYQGNFDFGGPIDPEERFLYRMTGVYRDSKTEVLNTSDDSLYVAPALTWHPDADTSLTLLSSFQQDFTSLFKLYYARFGGIDLRTVFNDFGAATGRPGLYDTYRKSYFGLRGQDGFRQTQYQIGYQFERHLSDIWTARQNVRYGHLDLLYKLSGPYTFDIKKVSTGKLTALRNSRTYDERLDAFAADNQLQAEFETAWLRHTLLMGVDYQMSAWGQVLRTAALSPVDLFAPVEGGTLGTYNLSASSIQDTNQVGFYVQDQVKLGPHWVLTLGARQDFAHQATNDRVASKAAHQDDDAITGRAGLTYLADNGWAPYLSWSTSFKPTPGTSFAGSPFKPTTGEQYEAGVKYQPDGWNALFTAAIFQITQENVTTQDPNATHVLLNPGAKVQTGEVRSRGVELEGRAELSPGWQAIAAFTYQDIETTKDTNRLAVGRTFMLIPNYMASGWIDYTVPAGPLANLGASLGVRYMGRNFGDPLNQIVNPQATFFDAALHYETDNWRLALNVTNLLDQKQETCSGSATALVSCYVGARRHIVGRITYRW